MKRAILLLSFLVVAKPAVAQEVKEDVTSTVVSEAKPKVMDKKFLIIGGLLEISGAMDIKSTFDSLGRCKCREANPILAPFVSAGPAYAYTVEMAISGVIMYGAGKMRVSEKSFLKKTWWILPIGEIILHSFAIHHNYGLKKTSPT